MGVKGFNREESNLTTTQVIKETLEVAANGSVSFRTRRGKGSGRPVEIAGNQFDTFVNMMNDIASRREFLTESAMAEDIKSAEEVTTDDDETTSE